MDFTLIEAPQPGYLLVIRLPKTDLQVSVPVLLLCLGLRSHFYVQYLSSMMQKSLSKHEGDAFLLCRTLSLGFTPMCIWTLTLLSKRNKPSA